MRRRTAELPLHSGRAPAWLFERMRELAGAITMAVVDEYGPRVMLDRLSDPWWFQAFGCVLGFDWHSSGLTTVTCGALKEAFRERGDELGILVAGGKGAASRKAPREIEVGAQRVALSGGEGLVHASRMSAKVDSAAVQDGFQVYHHSFFFAPDGAWCVVQQGMDTGRGRARRYHWSGASVDDFVCEPHAGIGELAGGAAYSLPAGRGPAGDGSRNVASGPGTSADEKTVAGASDLPLFEVLNLVDRASGENRDACAALAWEDPDHLAREVLKLTEGPTLFAPDRHAVLPGDVDAGHLRRVLRSVHEEHPEDFSTLLGSRGVGPATVRSLSLVAEVVHGVPAARLDPTERLVRRGSPATPPRDASPATPRWADYAYAHGGKDGTPFPVDRDAYDRSIAVLRDAVRSARLGDRRKSGALRRLADRARELGSREA